MTIDEIVLTIKNRLAETGHVWSDDKVKAKASEIFNAGVVKSALIGQAALSAEKHGAEKYSPAQHLKVITGNF